MAESERGRPGVARLSSECTAVVVLQPSDPADAATAGRALRTALANLYRGLPDTHVVAWATGGTVVAVAAVGRPAPSTQPARLVWGLPVAPGGEPDDAEVAAALDDPSRAREWLGGFLLADLTDSGSDRGGRGSVRLVTGHDLRPVLRVVEGPAGTALATRSLAAVVAAGRRPQVDRDHIAELVTFGAVLGDEELVAGVRRLDEGSVVDLDASGVTVEVVRSRGDRLAPGPATTPQQLRTSLGDVVESFAAVPDLHLAMTGGRDSLLLASCAAERALTLPAFTFGPSPDATAAAAVAASLGWPHREVGFGEGQRRLDEVVRLSCWTEGAVTGWDLAGPGPVWPGDPDATWFAGLGGETGRAFYWDERDLADHPAAYVVDRAADGLPPAVRGQLTDRLHEVLRALSEETGRSGVDLLDALYALGRVRGWMMRHRPMPFLRSTSAGYTSPGVTSVLLDLPRAARLDGSGFDRALALGPPLQERAAQALAAGASAPLQRTVQALRRRLRGRADPGGTLLVAFARELERDSVVRGTLGDDWWRAMLDHAPYDAAARLRGWQAVAVDAMDRQLSLLDLDREA